MREKKIMIIPIVCSVQLQHNNTYTYRQKETHALISILFGLPCERTQQPAILSRRAHTVYVVI